MAQPPHSQLLTAAARRILRPLGLQQRGRSRLWLDDHGWWVVVVEFRPSSWSKGSYLNVGAMWLWFEKDYFSFDCGYRVENLALYQDEAQFAPLAENFARGAADEVARLRSIFPSVQAAARQLAAKPQKGFWDNFHAGVACGLAGKTAQARAASSVKSQPPMTSKIGQSLRECSPASIRLRLSPSPTSDSGSRW